MGRKSFTIKCEINLKIICVPHSKLCKFDHIYVNVELFGETQKTKLLHPYFPIKSNDVFYFEKILWSPQTKNEALKLLKESPVSVELRHLPNKSSDSILLGYADTNAHKFLIADAKHDNDLINVERDMDLNQTEYHCGPSPKLKFNIRSTIVSNETPVMNELLEYYSSYCLCCEAKHKRKHHSSTGGQSLAPNGDMYSCECELHRDSDRNTNHCTVCHQDRTLSVCDKCLCKLKKFKEIRKEEISDFEDTKDDNFTEKLRPPFVVRKVPQDIVARKPDAYDSHYNQIIREQTGRKSARQKNLQRMRSCSPAKGKNENNSTKIRQSCYACLLPGEEVRINCDACNLTSRGELSNRNNNTVRPEPPMLKTFREVIDQRPIYEIKKESCKKCMQRLDKKKFGQDNSLYTSSRPLYLLDGYQNLAKYFCPDCSQ